MDQKLAKEHDVSELTGCVLGGVELVDLIGIGGAGSVYRGLRLHDGEEIAVKVFEPCHFGASAMRTRIIRELHAVAQLAHPHIVAIYGFREDEKTQLAYFAMEYVDGRDLFQAIERDGPISEKRALRILRAMLEALSTIHRAGFVHRDLKPDNILIAQDGTPKLTDFGLVRHLGDTGLTTEGAVLGTPLYMSPEQFSGADVDARADLYGLGCVIYHAVTGYAPFDGDFNALGHKHQNSPPVPPSQLAPWVTADFEQYVLRLMAKKPELRFPDALSALEALPGPKDPLAAKSSLRAAKRDRRPTRRLETTSRRERKETTRRRRRFAQRVPVAARVLLAGLSLAVLALSATVVTLLLEPNEPPPQLAEQQESERAAEGTKATAGVPLPDSSLPEQEHAVEAALASLFERIEVVLAQPQEAGLAARELLVELEAWRSEEATRLAVHLKAWRDKHPDSPLADTSNVSSLRKRLAEVGLGGWLERLTAEWQELASSGSLTVLEQRLATAARDIPQTLRDESLPEWAAYLDEAGRWREALSLARTLTRQAERVGSRQHARNFAQQVRAAEEELDIPRAARVHLFAPAHRELAERIHNGEPRRLRRQRIAGVLPGYEHSITREVIVERGERLDIAPGATLHFAPGARLLVHGDLFVHGTESAPVRFEPLRPEYGFGGVHIDGGRAHMRGAHFLGGEPHETRLGPSRSLLHAWEAELELIDCRFAGGHFIAEPQAELDERSSMIGGAAVFASRSHVTLERCRFEENTSHRDGGAVALVRCRHVRVEQCLFLGNRAAGDGGALMLWQCHARVIASTFANNRAGDSGGAVALVKVSSETVLVDSCFEANRAEEGKAILLRRCTPKLEGNRFACHDDAEESLPLLLELPRGMDRPARDAFLRRLRETNTLVTTSGGHE